MPLIVTAWTPRAGKPRHIGPLQRAQQVRQFCRRLAGGAPAKRALSHCGLTWAKLFDAISQDTTGQLARLFDQASRFSAHPLAAESVAVTDRPVRSMPDASAMGHRSKSRQWLASKLNPDAYGTAPAAAPPAQVHHHVVHLPQRGPAPDLQQIAVIGAAQLDQSVTGSVDRRLSSGSAGSVSPIVRNRSEASLESAG